ncbi:peptide ABC transporter substrate-binding protein [Erwinia sp. OLTSP20]|uniref:SgrR family transcriptional regulator n=1 Tax=unclassified Erwinia TaxID=2622719 RepID=UPI000C192410|nr:MULTISPECIES: SgrR family transcriptional regulator [unclassified Erwinia]PIJ52220.1 peptide ABC transporter substrate-binding protein [Erwinia sp. OAMSP11]PIJ75737.1 peptide ABC transporter substrate-binding protein [Erwinia sp. OLSSP12]PIJ81144.1 peptide ABC transporter substrate-binding protein [Erwinia sp. OLMTSP26]PIJ84227.1 peptide ABC transporter substrate-binding protein [Erwinia sp. OLCASP19]PIJ88692.1 peptide ABC transporter substrate-binding protein [Erwinia sp. OLMDSP33]
MRQLQRLNQYLRLWQSSEGSPQSTSVAAMAARCLCSERHMRTLLSRWQQLGWAEWQAVAGRGKRGTLRFYRHPEALRAAFLREELDRGQAQNALALAQVDPGKLEKLLSPLMGGQWLNNRPTLRIPYYRPFDSLEPLTLSGRAEQQLVSQLHAGLTRFVNNRVVADMAHHWQQSADGLSWHFYLRPQLHWHNGDQIEGRQLLVRLHTILHSDCGQRLLSSVSAISLPHALCLRFDLHSPDNWLAHRLASVPCLMAHPSLPQTGAGPYRLTCFSSALVRIESHSQYHLRHPLVETIEYWITPALFDRTQGTSCRHPVQIAIGSENELNALRPVEHSVSLGFCYMALRHHNGFTAAQARTLLRLLKEARLIEHLPLEEGLITPTRAMLPGWPVPPLAGAEAPLPATLKLCYHLPMELHAVAEALRQVLARHGCQLDVHFHPAKSWRDYPALAEADIIMGDRLIGEAPEFTLESWLRLDPLWPIVLEDSGWQQLLTGLQRIQQSENEAARCDKLRKKLQQLMAAAIITPLFNYRYQVSAPPGVQGIHLNAWGWFDFTRAWIPPPA